MKKILLIFSIIVTGSSIYAQDKLMNKSKPLHLSFGVDAGVPFGDYSKIIKFAIGGDLQLEYYFANHISGTASVGFDARLYKGGVVKTNYYVPLLGGLRYYFTDKVYISEQAGYSIKATKGLENAFTDVAGVGIKLTHSSDIMAGYKGLFFSGTDSKTLNLFEVRIAYNLSK